MEKSFRSRKLAVEVVVWIIETVALFATYYAISAIFAVRGLHEVKVFSFGSIQIMALAVAAVITLVILTASVLVWEYKRICETGWKKRAAIILSDDCLTYAAVLSWLVAMSYSTDELGIFMVKATTMLIAATAIGNVSSWITRRKLAELNSGEETSNVKESQ